MRCSKRSFVVHHLLKNDEMSFKLVYTVLSGFFDVDFVLALVPCYEIPHLLVLDSLRDLQLGGENFSTFFAIFGPGPSIVRAG